ncbi:MAG: outer membrane lipoprotein-sorting protein [Proteobacteria bacterium]|nr:outer membrane lipoprotein-sorting protein [Pseudomonadota bacterium]
MKYFAAAALALALIVPAAFAGDAEPSLEDLLNGVDDVQRGGSSHAKVSMHVKTRRWERTIVMESWSEGEDKSLIKIISPAKEAGTATLMVDDNIWNYLPKVDRTMKVPASMMSGAWMGSHFSNNDLVRSARLAEEFTYELKQSPSEDGTGHWIIECIPKEDAPVVWGKVVVNVRAEDRIPDEITYWDEDGELVRTMRFEDIQDVAGRKVPMRMMLIPADEPDEYTKVTYESLEFDPELPASTFTLQSIRK